MLISLSRGHSSSRKMESENSEQIFDLPFIPAPGFDPTTLPDLVRSGRKILVDLEADTGRLLLYSALKDSSINENVMSDNSTSPDSGRIDDDYVTIVMGDGTEVEASWIDGDYGLSWSNTLREMLSDSTIETEVTSVTLHKEDPTLHEIFSGYLFHGKIKLPDQEGPDPGFAGMWRRLVLAWLLGDCIQNVDFKDTVIDYLREQTTKPGAGVCVYPPKSVTKLVYDKTVPGSPLRRFIIDQYVSFGQPNWLDDTETDQLDKQFFLDLSKALLQRRLPTRYMSPDRRASNCVYHEHPADKNLCYKIKELHKNMRNDRYWLH